MSNEPNGASAPESSSESDPLIGTPYRLVRQLGRGGMGEVVLAEHRRLGKTLVVKLVHTALAHPLVAERLRVEAQILAKLSHPNLVEVTDLGITPAGRPYLAMEHLVGRTLQEEVNARGFIPVPEAIEIASDVLSALAAAHAAGVVHRDIKTENVFLHTDARAGGKRVVKVLDFGIAKVLASEQAVLPTRFPTEEGMILGTPRFCSPEQALGKLGVDHRADIYSVGAMLFAMVVGRRPFEEREMMELIRAHVMTPPPTPSAIAKQPLSPAMDQLILRALEKSPEQRFQSAEEMSAALQLVAAARPAPPPLAERLSTPGHGLSRPTVRMEQPAGSALPLAAPRVPMVVAVPPGVPTGPARAGLPLMAPTQEPAKTPIPTPIQRNHFDRFRFALLFAIVTMLFGIATIFTIRAIVLGFR